MSKDRKERVKEIKAVLEVAVLAMPKERASQEFYRNAARKAPGELSKRIFEELAQQEEQHEAKLKAIIQILEAELKSLE
jgi:rubrerythrin